MTKYNIWMEGFLITGMEGTPSKAWCVAEVEASSFKEACIKHFKDDSSFNEEYLSVWGCKLYDNELDARRSFG